MNTLFSIALIVSASFIVCYPIVMFIINKVINRMEAQESI